jgi:hypothetical protein
MNSRYSPLPLLNLTSYKREDAGAPIVVDDHDDREADGEVPEEAGPLLTTGNSVDEVV